MTSVWLWLALVGGASHATGWVSGPGRPCTYVELLPSGRRIAWFPDPCTVVQMGYLLRATRNELRDERGRVIGYRTAP